MKFLYLWNHRHCRPPRLMCFAYYSLERNECLFVIPPLNLIVALAWWIQDKWAQRANAPSWIEREVERRLAHRRNSVHDWRM